MPIRSQQTVEGGGKLGRLVGGTTGRSAGARSSREFRRPRPDHGQAVRDRFERRVAERLDVERDDGEVGSEQPLADVVAEANECAEQSNSSTAASGPGSARRPENPRRPG